MSGVKTRFAVSPTGYMHVGGVRNALFDWLVAKQSGGKFILRIEDTDQEREVQGALEHIIETLKILGLDWQEGPDKGGPNSPYLQSQRLAIYEDWAQKLVDAGLAYADPYTREETEAFRQSARDNKKPFLYRDYRPANPPKWNGSQPLRLKSNPQSYSWQDAVMGDLSAGGEAIDDFVLIKSDGFPTYNFCHIIDDHLMGITHVIRSQEFLASTPKYLNLYDALGIERPIFATLPWIMGPDGKKKLSKRDGAKDVLDYVRDGYLPEALVSFLATLGWNDGTEQEVFTIQELVEKFRLERVQKSGAKFDEARLRWVNGSFIRKLSLDELYDRVQDFWPDSASQYKDDYRRKVLSLVQERLKFFAELPELTSFFFEELPVNLELISSNKQLKKLDTDYLHKLLEQALSEFQLSDFSSDDLTNRLNKLLEATEQKPAVLFGLIRIVTTWSQSSPELSESLATLGKEETLRRIQKSLTLI